MVPFSELVWSSGAALQVRSGVMFMTPTFPPNFGKVGMAYCFWLVCVFVRGMGFKFVDFGQ